MAMNCNYWDVKLLKKGSLEITPKPSAENIKPVHEKTPVHE
jgi:hypothetical protein